MGSLLSGLLLAGGDVHLLEDGLERTKQISHANLIFKSYIQVSCEKCIILHENYEMRVKIIHTETSSEVSCTVGHTILTWEVQRVLTGGERTRQRRKISRGTEENLEESLLKRSHGKVRTAVPHRRRTQDHRPGA